MTAAESHRTDPISHRPPAGPTPRASDAALAASAAFAIEDLTHLITEAVKLSDDHLVARLDRVLQRVEAMLELSKGSPRDRRRH